MIRVCAFVRRRRPSVVVVTDFFRVPCFKTGIADHKRSASRKNFWFSKYIMSGSSWLKNYQHSLKTRGERYLNVVISKGVPQPHDLQNRIFHDLVMIMTWYLGWGDLMAWQTFSKFFANKCWLNFDIWCLICQNCPKNAKKGNCWLKPRGFCNIFFTAMIFGWELAQGV